MLYTIAAVLVLVLDQAVKFYTVRYIEPQAIGGACKTLIPGVIHMTNMQNTGAAFSILADSRWILVAVSVAFIIAIIVLISMDIIHTKFGRWTAVLVMAGALGNCIDRVLYGYVVDMFEIELFSFAVFNVADIFITVCGILFCIHVIVYREPEEERAAVPRNARRQARLDYDPAEEEDDDYYDEQSRRSPRQADRTRTKGRRAAKVKEDPYANIPHRGAHRSLEEELRPQDPDDPFAEWNYDEPAARRTKPAPAEPEAPISGRRTKPAADLWDDFDQDADQVARRSAARPAQQPAQPAQQPAPKKQAPADAGFDEYSLEDILSEFRDL